MWFNKYVRNSSKRLREEHKPTPTLPEGRGLISPTKIQPVVCAMVLPAWMRIPVRKPPQTGVLLKQP